jgi:hypothetical protein
MPSARWTVSGNNSIVQSDQQQPNRRLAINDSNQDRHFGRKTPSHRIISRDGEEKVHFVDWREWQQILSQKNVENFPGEKEKKLPLMLIIDNKKYEEGTRKASSDAIKRNNVPAESEDYDEGEDLTLDETSSTTTAERTPFSNNNDSTTTTINQRVSEAMVNIIDNHNTTKMADVSTSTPFYQSPPSTESPMPSTAADQQKLISMVPLNENDTVLTPPVPVMPDLIRIFKEFMQLPTILGSVGGPESLRRKCLRVNLDIRIRY